MFVASSLLAFRRDPDLSERNMRASQVLLNGLLGVFAVIGPVMTRELRAQQTQPPQGVRVQLRAALVGDDFAITPLPQTTFWLIKGADTIVVITSLDGTAFANVKTGVYIVESAAPVTFRGSRYAWRFPITVAAASPNVELTQRNATRAPAEPSAQSSRAGGGRRVSEEAQIFEAVKTGVFTVFGQQGKGSGFLVDARGLVLTNAHVLAGTDDASVQLNATTKVRAVILAVDKTRDVAVLAIAPGLVSSSAVLPLADGTPQEIATVGERVLAIGSPLNQTGVLTIGIVSSIEPRAIISDVNINHGNSGGPLLNLDGTVIAINTFGDFTDQGGPGISGSILITEALPLLSSARDSLARIAATLTSAPLPMASKTPFPIEGLVAAASQERMDLRPYAGSAGPFQLQFMTPPIMAFRQSSAMRELTRRRKGREARAGVAEGEKVDVIQGWVSWDEYVGGRSPVVVVQIMPEVGQTRGSFWGNLLGALAAGYSGTYFEGHQTLEFKGDFRRMNLYRNGTLIEPIERWRIPAVLNIADYKTSGRDYAFQGIYVYRPEDFAPNSDGEPATFTAEIINTSRPDRPVTFTVNPKTVGAVWRDFAPHRIATGAR